MPYVASSSSFEKKLYGNGQCVAFVRTVATMPPHDFWKEGDKVRGNRTIKPGTAIATFVDHKYPNLPSGNHAAIYVRQDLHGIVVYDQWKGKDGKPDHPVQLRTISFRKGAGSSSNDGDRYSVIELNSK